MSLGKIKRPEGRGLMGRSMPDMEMEKLHEIALFLAKNVCFTESKAGRVSAESEVRHA